MGSKALNTLSPKSFPLSAFGVRSIDWNNSWITLPRQLKYTHPTLLDRICENRHFEQIMICSKQVSRVY